MQSAASSSLQVESRRRTRAVFGDEYTSSIEFDDEGSHRTRIAAKIRNEYGSVKELPDFLAEKQGKKQTIQTKSIQTRLIEDVQRSQRFISYTRLNADYSQNES